MVPTLELHAHRDTLTILGTRRPAAEREEVYHRRERRSGAFTRTLQLPFRIDPERIEAQLENGVLRLTLLRPEEDKPRRIEVRVPSRMWWELAERDLQGW